MPTKTEITPDFPQCENSESADSPEIWEERMAVVLSHPACKKYPKLAEVVIGYALNSVITKQLLDAVMLDKPNQQNTCLCVNLISDDTVPLITSRGIVVYCGDCFLPAGSVLGLIFGSGKFALSDASATNGSDVPCAVLCADVDVSDGDVFANFYTHGHFNKQALTFGHGHNAETCESTLRNRGIFIH